MAEHWYRTSMGRANNFSKASSDVSIVTPPCPSTVSSLSRVHELTGPSLKRGVTVRERQHQPYPNEQVDDNQQRLSSTQVKVPVTTCPGLSGQGGSSLEKVNKVSLLL
ncbi:HTH-type transcriptional regulator BudR [Dissostichus eleginoides]|uniref:HTH-type transcriptional regulator BudR n=1 Tax=Dissostichus eleginoides TaxID=100907 RepID=A0AAD9BR59_DISEL|nr:HTH-type transcriptional regulator BudR [Dissostichus eleginoides]